MDKIVDKLERLYDESAIQLGAAFAVARGVWHWNADNERLWRVEHILNLVLNDKSIRVLDNDGILFPGWGDKDRCRMVAAADYKEAARGVAAHRWLPQVRQEDNLLL